METLKLCILFVTFLALASAAPSDSPTDAPSAEVQSSEGTQAPTESAALVESVNPTGDSSQEPAAANIEETTAKEEKAAEMNAAEESTTEKVNEPTEKPQEKIQEPSSEKSEKAQGNVEKAGN